MQDKGHNTANLPMFEIMPHGIHAFKSQKYKKSALQHLNFRKYSCLSHIQDKFSSSDSFRIWNLRKLSIFEKELLAQGHICVCE